MPAEDSNEEVIPAPEHVSRHEPNAIVAVSDPVLSRTDVYTPTDSLLRERIMTPTAVPATNASPHSILRVSPVGVLYLDIWPKLPVCP